ncbi:hypothetical protein BC834DRAFT_545285 [Gloeopeniophorella convolvens]|nr:hypothetical protein BC834DRAFT_545285 [Gloeopeniophorella convolvens]
MDRREVDLESHADDIRLQPVRPASEAIASHSADSFVSQETFSDSSGPLFSMYMSRAERYDKECADRWRGYADGILVFTGLFSATVAAFIIESYKNLQPDPEDTTTLLLAQMSQQLAGLSNGTHVPAISSAAFGQTPFHPPSSAIRVNILWLTSLLLSLACALLATLLQQWARRYLQLTQSNYALHKRARVRAFFAEGVHRFQFETAVEALPALLHLSVALFFAGLIIFLFDINHTVSYVVVSCIALTASAYFLCSFIPLLHHDSPYSTPLSTLLWFLVHAASVTFLGAINSIVEFVDIRRRRSSFRESI